LKKIADKLQIGLTPELDSIYDILAQKGIIKSISSSTITFSTEFAKML